MGPGFESQRDHKNSNQNVQNPAITRLAGFLLLNKFENVFYFKMTTGLVANFCPFDVF